MMILSVVVTYVFPAGPESWLGMFSGSIAGGVEAPGGFNKEDSGGPEVELSEALDL
jgi:hypothetical protein